MRLSTTARKHESNYAVFLRHVVATYESGLSMKETARACDISEMKVLRIISSFGTAIPRGQKRGPENPSWKGGVTPLIAAIRTCKNYSEWRRKIYIQAQHTCAFCGVVSSRDNPVILQCDHIIPLALLVQTNSISSLTDAESCAALWNVSNGRILCKPCHKKTDTYGRNLKAQGL